MEADHARQMARRFFKDLGTWRRWPYRKAALERYREVFHQAGITVEAGEEEVVLSKKQDNETLMMRFKQDRTIGCEVADSKGVIALVVTPSAEAFLTDHLLAAKLSQAREA